jgi:hypothetical protein
MPLKSMKMLNVGVPRTHVWTLSDKAGTPVSDATNETMTAQRSKRASVNQSTRHSSFRLTSLLLVQELLSECSVHQLPALLEAVSKVLGSISESRWQTLCDAAGRLDAERAVSQCGAKVFLRKKGSRNGEINNQEKG